MNEQYRVESFLAETKTLRSTYFAHGGLIDHFIGLFDVCELGHMFLVNLAKVASQAHFMLSLLPLFLLVLLLAELAIRLVIFFRTIAKGQPDSTAAKETGNIFISCHFVFHVASSSPVAHMCRGNAFTLQTRLGLKATKGCLYLDGGGRFLYGRKRRLC